MRSDENNCYGVVLGAMCLPASQNRSEWIYVSLRNVVLYLWNNNERTIAECENKLRRENMAKFRKKPVVIEAVQWHKHGDHSAVRKTSYTEVAKILHTSGCSREEPYWSWEVLGVVETLEGDHVVIPGDWIIRGVNGEYYPCKPDIFEKTYEAVED